MAMPDIVYVAAPCASRAAVAGFSVEVQKRKNGVCARLVFRPCNRRYDSELRGHRGDGGNGTIFSLSHGGKLMTNQQTGKNMRRNLNKSGFTMIELMTVVVVIGILAAIAIPGYVKFAKRAKEAVVRENMRTVQLAMEAFSVDRFGGYPSQADEPALKVLFSNGMYPDNPFDNLETTVSWNADPTDPGDMGIFNLAGGGYTIKGHGATALFDPIVVGD
jgi:general secretion pathway protein G